MNVPALVLSTTVLIVLPLLVGACANDSHCMSAARAEQEPEFVIARDDSYVLDFTMDRIDGTPEELRAYQGRVLLLVNVASECGLTPQYTALQSLHTTKSSNGFAVLGFPANNFGGQEPGSNKQIAQFCTGTYSVTFPMFAKISVKGEDAHPLYQRLASQPEPIGGEPEWNFTKFVIDRNGRVVARFGPRVAPDDPELVAVVDGLLAQTTLGRTSDHVIAGR